MKTESPIEPPIKNLQTAFRQLKADIAEHPFLRGLSPKHLATLSDFAMNAEFASGKLIFSEGDPANRFYLILEGKVALEARAENGDTVPVQTIGPGDVLGWSWLFPPYSWHFDARAIEPTKAIFFYGTSLREQCQEDSSLGYELMKRAAAIVIERLQAARGRLTDASALGFHSQNQITCQCVDRQKHPATQNNRESYD